MELLLIFPVTLKFKWVLNESDLKFRLRKNSDDIKNRIRKFQNKEKGNLSIQFSVNLELMNWKRVN